MQGQGVHTEFLDSLLEGCLIVDPDWQLLFLNEAAARQLRRPRDELLGRNLRELFPNFEKTPLFASLARFMTTRESTHLSQQLTFPDGATAFFELGIHPVEAGVQILSLDATGHRDSEQQLSRFFSLSPDLMAVAGFDGRFRQLSPSWEKVLGYPPAELTTRPWLDFVHPDDQEGTIEAGRLLMRGEEVKLFVNRYRCHDGSWRWIEWHCTPDIDRQQIFAVAHDVTERKFAETALHNVALFPEENPSPVLRVDRNGTLLFANRATAPLLTEWHCTIGQDVSEAVRTAIAAAFARGCLYEFEMPCGQRVISFMVKPFLDRGYANLYGHDVTDRVRAKEVLRSNLQRFELLTWTAGELLKAPEPQHVVEALCRKVMALLGCDAFFNYLLDKETGQLHLNAAAGIPAEVIRQIEWLDFGQAVCGCVARDGCRIVAEHIPDSTDERTALVKSFGIKAYACHPLTGTDGAIIGTLSFGTRSRETFSDDDLSLMKVVADQVAIAMIRLIDVEALRDRELRLRRAEAAAHLGHWRLHLGNKVIQWSDELYRIFGVDRDSFVPTLENYQDMIHPDDRDDARQIYERICQHGSDTFEFRIIRPDGSLRHVACYGEIERDSNHHMTAMFGTLQDFTDILQNEKELRIKNAEVEHFAYAVSHDLRSPLVTVKTFLDCLEQDLENGNTARIEKDIYFMRTATTKMARLLDELFEMTRIGRVISHPEHIALKELTETALALVAGRIVERQVRIVTEIPAITLYGDRSRLVEIWQNLLENAVKFIGDQPTPLIELGAEQRGREMVFSVRDNGVGIDPRFQGKIFGLFEKLEARSEGTGLGLALVKRIVEMYDGRIWVESAGTGQGATFRFTLPGAVVNSSKGGIT